jgi:hypothetical protein
MELRERIDLKLFVNASLVTHLISLIWADGLLELLVLTVVYIGILISFYLLLRLVNNLLKQQLSQSKQIGLNSFSMFQMMFGHLILLILALSIGVHFMGNRIIISLLNYCIQIFILGFALRKNLK